MMMEELIVMAIVTGIIAAGGGGSAAWLVLRTEFKYMKDSLTRIEKQVEKINGRVDEHDREIAIYRALRKGP